jgi:hypothetical protein
MILDHHLLLEDAFAATKAAIDSASRTAALKRLGVILTGHAIAEVYLVTVYIYIPPAHRAPTDKCILSLFSPLKKQARAGGEVHEVHDLTRIPSVLPGSRRREPPTLRRKPRSPAARKDRLAEIG